MTAWRAWMWVAVVAGCSSSCSGGGRPTGDHVPTDTVADTGTGRTGTPADTGGVASGCSSVTPAGLRDCVEQARYEQDLAWIAKPRASGTDHWAAVRDLCASRFEALGYEVERHEYGSGTNIIGVRKGASLPTEQVVISAHYDSVPGCAGADDNATGVAGVLEAARVLASTAHARTLVMACWDQEEQGLIGSNAWTNRAAERSDTITMAFVLEMIGYSVSRPQTQTVPLGFDLIFPDLMAQLDARNRTGDFLAVVIGDDAQPATVALTEHAAALGLPVFPIVLDAGQRVDPLFGQLNARSDHHGFWKHGFPATMLTDTSEFRYPHYHCAEGAAVLDTVPDTWPVKNDAIEHLDPAFATAAVRVTVAAAAVLAN